MKKVYTEPMPFQAAEKYLANLIESSNAFKGGSRAYVGRLKKSYGYGKVIGIKSFDNAVSTRIDYDPEKGYHFNYVNNRTEEKICILINDMDEYQYRDYIDMLTKDRAIIDPTKRPVLHNNKDVEEEDLLIAFYEYLYESSNFDDILAYYESLQDEKEKIICKGSR